MNKYFLGLCLMMCTLSSFFGQISISNIRNINVSQLSESDITRLRTEMNNQDISMAALENMALSNGMSATDFSILKTRLEEVSPTQAVNQEKIEKGTLILERPIQMDEFSRSQIFGSELFTTPSMSFEPNSNMATPSTYILGAGDEIQLVIYGLQEFAGSLQVSKEGKVNIPVVGQVFVSGLSFDAATVQIKKACAKIYTTLNSGQSQLSMTLTKIRTIRITIIGAKRPGNYSVSSLSTVFNALHVAGGPSDKGSYRNIELIRDNKVIKIVDIYKFLTKGDQSDNINLQENDLIRIPVYSNRVKIEGNVKTGGVFELLEGETFTDLLEYCGGFDEAAYRKNIKLIQNSSEGLKIVDMTEEKYNSYVPTLGDVFKVSQNIAKLENRVSVTGSVFRPDDYEFVEGMTIVDLIKKADGLLPEAYTNRAIIIREKEDLTKELIDINLSSSDENGNLLKLQKNDQLVISSSFDFRNQFTVKINGQVKNGGEFPYIDNMTLYDLILMAGGFTEKASKNVEITSIIIKDEKSGENTKMSEIRTFEIDTLLIDQSKNFSLKPYDIVQIRTKPVFEAQRSVSISGLVEYPGVYVVGDKKERILDIINRAGGFKYGVDKNSIRVVRVTEQYVGDLKTYKKVIIPVDYDEIIKRPSSKKNFSLQIGDEILVGEQRGTVIIAGNVQRSVEVTYSGKGLRYYISAAGGLLENSDKKHIYIIQSNGMAKKTKSFLGIRNYPKVAAGSEIVVPVKTEEPRSKMSSGEIFGLAGIFSSIAGMTVAIINVFQ